MKTEPIESNPSQGPSSAQKPEQQPQQEPQSQFDPSLVTLEYSIGLLNEAIRNSPIKPGDSNYGTVVDQQILLQASAAISHLRLVLENERVELSVFKNTNTNLVRAINLLERSRSRIHRGEVSSARIALKTLELQNKEQRAKPERDEAVAFLQAELAQGSRATQDIIKTAKELGISLKTLKRAKADLGIILRLDCTNQRAWYWSLPAQTTLQKTTPPADTADSSGEDTQPSVVAQPMHPRDDSAHHTLPSSTVNSPAPFEPQPPFPQQKQKGATSNDPL